MGLKLPQPVGDPVRSLRETAGQGLDIDLSPRGQRLDVQTEAQRDQRQLLVLGQMIADDRETRGVAEVVVLDPGGVSVLLLG